MSRSSLGKAIATARQEKKLTQQELAEAMNVTDKAVSAWERGVACPDVKTFSKLGDILEVSVDELLALPRPSQSDVKRGRQIGQIVDVVLLSLGIAAGVAVVVLGVLGKAEVGTMSILLGGGLFAVSLFLLDQHTNE